MVYLIHLDQPIGHAWHYVGWALDADARLKEHQADRGGRLLKVANARGIGYKIVRVWKPADRRFERRVKNASRAPELCPICSPDTWQNNIPFVGDTGQKEARMVIRWRRMYLPDEAPGNTEPILRYFTEDAGWRAWSIDRIQRKRGRTYRTTYQVKYNGESIEQEHAQLRDAKEFVERESLND